MKKFTLFSLLLLLVTTAMAQTNSYTTTEGFEAARTNSKVYALKTDRSPLYFNTENNELAGYWTSSGDALKGSMADATSTAQQFAFLRTDNTAEGMYYMYSIEGQKFIGTSGDASDTPVAVAWFADVTYNSGSALKLYLGDSGDNVVNVTYWNSNTAGGIRYNTNVEVDAGNAYTLIACDTEVDLTTVEAAIMEYETVDYTPNFTGEKTRTTRVVTSVSVAGDTYTLTSDEQTTTYVDKTSEKTVQVYAGATVSLALTQSGSESGWMNAYVYVDKESDGFTAGVESDGYTPTGDLVSFSFYSNSSTSDASGYNSAGQSFTNNDRSTVALPDFVAPTEPGTYRIRFKYDWNNIDPAGGSGTYFGNTFTGHGGAIIDFNLEVIPYEIIYNYTNEGVTLLADTFSLAHGAAYPTYGTLPLGVTNIEYPTGTVTADGTYDVPVTIDESVIPFVMAATYSDIRWYYMKNNVANEYLSYTADQEYIPLNSTTKEDADNYKWGFVGNPLTGYKIVNKAAGEGMILSSSTTMTSSTDGSVYPVLTAEASLPEGNNTYWFVQSSSHGTNGFFIGQQGYPANRINHRNDKLAYWVGGADSGSTFILEDGTKLGELQTLIEQMEYMAAYVNENVGGYSTENENYVAEFTAISDFVTNNGATASDAEIEEKIAELQALMGEFTVNMPVDGKAYTFKFVQKNGTAHYLQHTSSATSLTTDQSSATVYICRKLDSGKYVFVNNEGKYLVWRGGDSNTNGASTEHRGWVDSYSTTDAWCDFEVRAFVANGSYVSVDLYKLSGYVTLWAKRNDTDTGCLIVKNTGVFDTSNANFHNDTYSSAVAIEEATYSNTPTLNDISGSSLISGFEGGMATFSAPFPTVLPADGSVKAYYAKEDGVNEKYISLTEYTGEALPANQGFILVGETGEKVMRPAASETTTDISSENLLGNSAGADKDMTGISAYILTGGAQGAGFYNCSGGTLAMNKAYMVKDATTEGASLSIEIRFPGMTGIDEVLNENETSGSQAIYDLSGRKVENPTRGIYIVNGKKMLVK